MRTYELLRHFQFIYYIHTGLFVWSTLSIMTLFILISILLYYLLNNLTKMIWCIHSSHYYIINNIFILLLYHTVAVSYNDKNTHTLLLLIIVNQPCSSLFFLRNSITAQRLRSGATSCLAECLRAWFRIATHDLQRCKAILPGGRIILQDKLFEATRYSDDCDSFST